MQDSFDPYVQWLEIPKGRRPPDHYRLLGLKPLENNPELIARAADLRMARIRKIRPGEHLADWGRLLDQLNAAKVCLLGPASKAAYDASLPNRPWQPAPDTPDPVTPAVGPLAAAIQEAPQAETAVPRPVAAGPVLTAASRGHGVAARKKSVNGLAIAVLAVLMAGLGGAFYCVLDQGPQRVDPRRPGANRTDTKSPPAAPEATQPPDPPDPPEKPSGTQPPRQPQPMPKRSTPPSDRPAMEKPFPAVDPAVPRPADPPQPPDLPRPPNPETEKPEPQVDTKRQAAFARAVSGARLSMSKRDVRGARRHLEAAARDARTSADHAQVARLRTMLGHLEEFWNGVREGVSKLIAGQELVIKDTRIAVVDATRHQLVARAAGVNRSWPIEGIPTSILIAVAEQSFPKDAVSKVHLGTFLAVDADGDPGYARQLWQEAARQGVDLKELMPELDVDFADASAGGVPTVDPPTDQARLRRAEQLVRQTFQAGYAEATNSLKKQELAEELLARTAATQENSDVCFVMFREARDLAVSAGRPALAVDAIDRMAKLFAIDAIQMKIAALEAAGQRDRRLSSRGHREIAEGSLGLVEKAVEAGRLDEAARLATLAVAAARNSRSRTLIKRAFAAKGRVEGLQKQGLPMQE